MLDELNADRQAAGLAALPANDPAVAKAQAWAKKLARDNALSHSNLAAGLEGLCWRAIGENVGYGSSIAQVEDGYMGSSGHQTNILNPRWDVVGVERDHGRRSLPGLHRPGLRRPLLSQFIVRTASEHREAAVARRRGARRSRSRPMRCAGLGQHPRLRPHLGHEHAPHAPQVGIAVHALEVAVSCSTPSISPRRLISIATARPWRRGRAGRRDRCRWRARGGRGPGRPRCGRGRRRGSWRWASTPSFTSPGSAPSSWLVSDSTSSR